MESKIKKNFTNSRFYKNYNNIDNVILHFKKIKNENTSIKNNYKTELIRFINLADKNNMQYDFSKKFISFLVKKYSLDCVKNGLDVSNKFYQIINEKNMTDKIFLYENYETKNAKILLLFELIIYNNILGLKIKIGKNIKNYVKYSVDINSDFIKSIKPGNIKNINFLIEKGANIHFYKECAFNESIRIGNVSVVKFLEEKGAGVYIKYEEALSDSIRYGRIEIVKHFAEKKSNFHIYKEYALKESINYGKIEIFKFLVGEGIDITTNKHYLIELSIQSGRIEIVKFLFEIEGVRVDINRLLMLSIKCRNIGIVKYLVEKGADIYCYNNKPITISIEYGYVEITKYLIEKI
jgi:hypothetical protein